VAFSKTELQQMAESVPFWWHSIDLGEGVVTKGEIPADVLAETLRNLQLPDLRGRTVLDIGAFDGFYSFAAERQGAKRVLALDHYVWSLDLAATMRYWRECRDQGTTPQPYHTVAANWHPDLLPGKQAYDTAHKALGSRVETRVADFMEMDLADLGTFDVVLYLGVLYHMENPFHALKRLAAVTGELAVIETEAAAFPGYENHAVCEFFETDELNHDVSNWWAPNAKALIGMCRAAGFRRVEILVGPPQAPPDSAPEVLRYRAVAHAWKNGWLPGRVQNGTEAENGIHTPHS
jgi:tRNA (mo5U34)-methyltransferase